MQLEAKLRINNVVEDWRTGFYGDRIQPQGFTQGQQAPPEEEGPQVGPSKPTLPAAPPPQNPQEMRRSEVFGEQEIPELDEVEL